MSVPLNIFLIIHDFSGARTYTDELAAYLKTKVNVYNVYLNRFDFIEFSVEFIADECNVYIPTVKNISNEVYGKNCAKLLYSHFKYLENVIIHYNYHDQYFLVRDLKRYFNCALVFTYHFVYGQYSCYDKINALNDKKVIKDDKLEQVLQLSDHIICVTGFAKRCLNKIYNVPDSKSSVIYNGIKTEKESLLSDSADKHKTKYGFNKKDRIILFAGLVDKRKGLEQLIDAFLLIKDDYPDIKLVIAGSVVEKDYLKLSQSCPGRIIFIGNIDKQTLLSFYSFSEIGVVPSKYEQCSYVAIEMMHNGLPIIISDVPGLNELISHKKTGLICKTKANGSVDEDLAVDINELAINIRLLLDNRPAAKEMAVESEKSAVKNFNIEKMGNKTLSIYKNIIPDAEKGIE